MIEIDTIKQQGIEFAMTHAPKLALSIATLFLGLWLVGIFTRILKKWFAIRELDESLQSFFISLTGIGLRILLVISVAGMVGIEVTSFIAILGAASLSIGMALSGTLQNFAGGIMILLFRPFKIGDFIEAQGYSGTVKEIQIFNTILKTPDNKIIIIPNAPISSNSMINYSAQETRRVDFTFGVGYEDNIDQVKDVLKKIAAADSRIFKDPEPFVALSELADCSVNFVLRVWANSSDYWGIYYDTLETVKKEFDKQGISIPYPQRDIHMYSVAE